MPHAVLLYFDPATERAICAVWKALADTHIAPYLHESPNRPHIKLAIFENLDVPAAQARLKLIAAQTPALALDFKQIGIFPNARPTIFAAPAATPALLSFQARIDQALCDLGDYPPYDFFRAGHWLPHCLLAMDLPPESLHAALDVCLRLVLPMPGAATQLGLIEFHPVRHILTEDFQ